MRPTRPLFRAGAVLAVAGLAVTGCSRAATTADAPAAAPGETAVEGGDAVGKTTQIWAFDNMYADSANYPLPGARKYGLLVKMDGSYRATGTSYTRYATSYGIQPLSLRINDDVPGNGNGCFNVNVKVYH